MQQQYLTPRFTSGLALLFSGGMGQAGPLATSMALVLQEALPWCGLLGRGSEVKALPLCW